MAESWVLSFFFWFLGFSFFGFWFWKPSRNCQWLQSSERTMAHVQCRWLQNAVKNRTPTPSVNFLFCCNFHNLEAPRLALRPSLCASRDLNFYPGSTVTNYFKFSLAGTSTIALYSLEPPWASLCPCVNMFCVRGVASGRPRRASKRLDCRLWEHWASFINIIERERLSWPRQAGTRSFGFVFGTWNWYDFWRRSWGLPCIFLCPTSIPISFR